MARILLITRLAHLPDAVSGAQRSGHALLLGLQRAGHEVAVLCALRARTLSSVKDRLRRSLPFGPPVLCDHVNGYPTYRSWRPEEVIGEVASEMRADLAISHNAAAPRVRGALPELPLLVCLLDVFFETYDLAGVVGRRDVAFMANSRFIAERFRRTFGQAIDYAPPIIDAREVQVEAPGEAVVFVNPLPMKGLAIAFELAEQNPGIPFLIFLNPGMSADARRAVEARAAALDNLRLHAPVQDARRIYRHARILLAPSQVEEAWGRVATEAQASGIPVLASAIGGLVEAVGEGGLLVDPEAPVASWSAALRRLWDDRELYARCRAAALARARRPEIAPAEIVAKFESAVQALLRDRPPPATPPAAGRGQVLQLVEEP